MDRLLETLKSQQSAADEFAKKHQLSGVQAKGAAHPEEAGGGGAQGASVISAMIAERRSAVCC
eukprot:6194944-Pleurochrysis_carterae.AAC.1